MTLPETLIRVYKAGGRLQAQPGGELLVLDVTADDLGPGLVAQLKRHKLTLHRYVSCFPNGCWPSWKGPPMD